MRCQCSHTAVGHMDARVHAGLQDGRRFQLDEHPFVFAGTNCYWLMVSHRAPQLLSAGTVKQKETSSSLPGPVCLPETKCSHQCMQTRAAEANMQPMVCEVLDAVKGAGLTVVRTWAFGEGSEWNALQPEAGACPPLSTALGALLGEKASTVRGRPVLSTSPGELLSSTGLGSPSTPCPWHCTCHRLSSELSSDACAVWAATEGGWPLRQLQAQQVLILVPGSMASPRQLQHRADQQAPTAAAYIGFSSARLFTGVCLQVWSSQTQNE